MKILITKDSIEKAILSIQTRGKKLDQDIHIAGVSCLQHIELHGDVSLLNRLVVAMPKGSRVNALRDWAGAYGKVQYDEETKEFKFDKTKTTLLEEAQEKSWTEFKLELPYQVMDFEGDIAKVLKKAFSRASSEKGDLIDGKKLRAVAKIMGYKQEVK